MRRTFKTVDYAQALELTAHSAMSHLTREEENGHEERAMGEDDSWRNQGG